VIEREQPMKHQRLAVILDLEFHNVAFVDHALNSLARDPQEPSRKALHLEQPRFRVAAIVFPVHFRKEIQGIFGDQLAADRVLDLLPIGRADHIHGMADQSHKGLRVPVNIRIYEYEISAISLQEICNGAVASERYISVLHQEMNMWRMRYPSRQHSRLGVE